jgi:caffeoyl-CoA O-methyltransferase
MDFLPKEIAQYSEKLTEPEALLLQQLNRETHAKILSPRMLSGHLQGRVLAMFSQMMQPSRILEVGTYTGYATLCLAEGLTNDGKIISIEANEELESFTRSFFEKSVYHNKIDFRIGQALAIIPTLSETFDMVFIDADKANNANYFDIILPKVRQGGYIITDNVLWSGKVANEKMDKDTANIHAFNEKCLHDSRVEALLLPIRDGLMICRKK